ncbi:polysaccharide biosynthesis tyrosine autokinase [Gemmatimonadota bacterium]
MARTDLNLRDYYQIIRRHLVVVIAVTLGMGGITSLLATPQVNYRATSTVRIVQTTDMTGLILQAFDVSLTDNISTQTRMITSQPVLLEVAQRMVLIPPEVNQEEAVDDFVYRSVLADLSSSLEARQVEFSGLIEIVATRGSEEETLELASTTAKAFADYSNEVANARNTEALAFINRQLANTTTVLDSLERELKDSRQANLPNSLTDIDFIKPLIEQRRTLQIRLTSLEEQMQRLGGGVGALSSPGTALNAEALQQYSSMYSQLSNMLADRANLLVTYTDSAIPVRDLDARIGEARITLLNAIQNDASRLRTQLDDLDDTLNSYPDEEIRLAKLNRSVDLHVELVTQLEASRQEAMIRKAEQVREVTVINYPTLAVPTQVSERSIKTIIGLILGLMLGVIIAFLLETLDTSIGNIEDLEEYLEAPVLAVIPHLDVDEIQERLVERDPRLQGDPDLPMFARLITQYDPRSPVAEAYRALRTNLQFATEGAGESRVADKTFLFTSASLAEGKTTTLINLAITVAQAGMRVLVVGCNMRRPTLYKSFGLPRERGVVDILTGQMEWQDCVKTVTDMLMAKLSLYDIMAIPGLDNLHIITAGGIPPNPSELLSSPRFGELLAEVREQYDLVLVDAPPILPVTDAAIIGRQVDWSVLVYQVGLVPRNALRRAKAHLTNVGARLLGIAMNDVRGQISGYSPYSQYMEKYYGEEGGGRKSQLPRLNGLWSKKSGTSVKGKKDEQHREAVPKVRGEPLSWIDIDYYEEVEEEVSGEDIARDASLDPATDNDSAEVVPPETESPEMESPEVEPPETESPEMETPEVDTPEAPIPEVMPPAVAMPSVKPAEVEPPETESPEMESSEVAPSEVEPPEAVIPRVRTPMVVPSVVVTPEVEPPESTSGKTSSQKSAARKTAGKKTASKKSASRKTAGKKTAGKKTAGKKTAGKKTAGKKTAGKKTAGKKAPSKKRTSRKVAGPTSVAKKRTSRKVTGKKTVSKKRSSRKTAGKKRTSAE